MIVLLVDDNERFRQLLRDCLPDFTDKVYECGDGNQALSLFKKYRPDWVLMDWEMPRKNGIAAMREILAEYPKAKICLLTAFNEEEIRLEALAAGAREFLLKDDLLQLETILNGNLAAGSDDKAKIA